MSKLSIVIPVYYNSDTLEALYKDMKRVVLSVVGDYEIVMVDDGSGDNSWEVMNTLAKKDSKIKLVKLSRNFGSHAAILAGLLACTGDCATIKAADLQEPSEILLKMYDSWNRGNKVVLAVRSDRKESFSQKMFANLYYWLVRKFALPSMPQGGFDCYLIDRKVIEVLRMLDETNSAVTLQVLWAGFKRDTIYYVRQQRETGTSRWTLAKKIKLVVDSLIGFSFAPIRFMSLIGGLFAFVSFIWMLIVMVQKVIGDIQIQGWTTLMIVLLFSSGLILLTLGILGEYIWRILEASRNRPVYIVEEVREKYSPDSTDNKVS